MSYDAAVHRENLRLQDEVIGHLRAAGVFAKIECPGYILDTSAT
jgi:hypothetical protein